MKNYKLTTISCFVGIFVQAIITNLTAILFIPMMEMYNLQYKHLGILVAINFTAQVSADIGFSKMIDKVGYRKIILPTCAFAFVGLLAFALAPYLFRDNIFVAVAVATAIFAFSSGLLEILLSPIIAGIPGSDKGPAMSLMHSFYAWGQVATIIVTTLALFLIGRENWQLIVIFWAVVPLVAFFMFFNAPFPDIIPDEHRLKMSDLIFKPFYIAAMLAIFAGGCSEVVMNQWASTFMERGLALTKLTGDLIGMCGFAFMIGIGRLLYGIYGSKVKMYNILILGSALCIVCYLFVALSTMTIVNVIACIVCGLAVSLLWPGTIVIASEKYPLAGAWMFAILAAAGDIGAGFGPWLTGFVVDKSMDTSFISKFSSILNVTAEQGAIRFGLLVAVIFPVIALIIHLVLKSMKTD